MTLILLLLATLFPSTTPVTIHTTHERTVMAQGLNGPPGGGNNNQNRGHTITSPGGHPPVYNPGSPRSRGAGMRIGRDASNPTTYTEHTQRPQPR